jgi:2-C-methyl-D-erythritol 4-phosphate cytidylyltransferase
MTTSGEVWAIVLAGGIGARFGHRPKQFERVGGRRMVDRTVSAALRTCDRVALVLPLGYGWDGEPVHALAAGGDHQSESLRAGLETLPTDASIAVVADPAHPLAPDALFEAVIDKVRRGADGAVPVLPIHDVVQRVRNGRVVETLPKHDLVITASPHAFRVPVLRAVHASRPRPVENSSLLLEWGYRVDTVPGDPANLHVTTREELEIVRNLVAGRSFGPALEQAPLGVSHNYPVRQTAPQSAEGHFS